MWIRAVAGKGPAVKLAAMVDCALWHDSVGMLAFIADHKLVNLYCLWFPLERVHRALPFVVLRSRFTDVALCDCQ